MQRLTIQRIIRGCLVSLCGFWASCAPTPNGGAQSEAYGPSIPREIEGGWFQGMLNPPPLVPALPSNFILASASEHTDPGEYDMYDGVLWAPERTARQYEFQAETNLKRAKDPLFWVRLSSSVGHKPGTDQFSHEESMDAAFAKVGVKNYKKAKHKWGPYPVLSVSGERPNGSTFFSAWIGTHLPGGWAILVDYRTPQGRGHPTAEERRIWEDFLKKTKAK